MRTIKVKAIVSSLLLLFSLLILITGIGLWLSPPGRIAKATGWTYLGFQKETLGDMHFYIAVVLVVIAVTHLFLNFKVLLRNIESLFKK